MAGRGSSVCQTEFFSYTQKTFCPLKRSQSRLSNCQKLKNHVKDYVCACALCANVFWVWFAFGRVNVGGGIGWFVGLCVIPDWAMLVAGFGVFRVCGEHLRACVIVSQMRGCMCGGGGIRSGALLPKRRRQWPSRAGGFWGWRPRSSRPGFMTHSDTHEPGGGGTVGRDQASFLGW